MISPFGNWKKVLAVISMALLAPIGGGLYAQNLSADSLYNLGSQKKNVAEYGQAADYFQQSMKLYLQKGDSLRWSWAKRGYAITLIRMGKVHQGLGLLLDLDSTKGLKMTARDKAFLKKSIGFAYRNLEQYATSRKYYNEGLEFAKNTGDSLEIARFYNNISYTFSGIGDYEQALAYQHQARQIFEKHNEQRLLSNVLNGIFLTMMDLGLYQQAESYIRRSLAIREQLGNPDLLDEAYHNLAWNSEKQGKHDNAIIYYRKSLELSRELDNPYDITQTLINIGDLYEHSGDYNNALAYYNEALETNYQTERSVSIAHNLMRLAEVAIKNNDLDNAENFYQEALTWLEKANVPQELAWLYLNIAELKLEQGYYGQAKKYVADAKNISRENFTAQLYYAHNVLGKIYKAEGKLRESLEEYHRAYTLYSDRGKSSKIRPAMNLARAYNEVYSDSAFTYAEEAFTLIDSIRTNVAGVVFRSGFFREHAGFYNEVASWYISQKNDPKKAFELVEAAKARVLMDELAEAQENAHETLDEATLIKKQQKAKQIDRLYSQLEQANSEQEAASIRNELKDLEFEYQSFLNELHASSRKLKNFSYPKPVTAAQARDMLNSKTAILEYAFAGNSMVRLFITQEDITATVVDSIRSTDAKSFLTKQVKSFRQAITRKAKLEEIKELGAALYEELISDLKAIDISNLLIVSDGPLTFLPFETLPQKGRYLIEDFNIKYLPSVSIYPFINAPHRLTNSDLLAVAGSGFEEAENVARSTRSQASFASLPSTLLEVDSIAVNFPHAKILKNEDVTEAILKSHNLGDFRFLHFATHAAVNEETPSQSGLLLSKKAEVESLFGEDGHLNSREISGLKLNADLVTLSACNTGMGKIVTGEGLLGLQRSFLSAGASSVMVSLWSIYDRSTSEFMSTFYRQMLVHERQEYGLWNQTLDWFGMYEYPLFDYKSKALKDAKLEMIDHPYYSHPVYWAPFILVGK